MVLDRKCITLLPSQYFRVRNHKHVRKVSCLLGILCKLQVYIFSIGVGGTIVALKKVKKKDRTSN